MVKSNFKLVKDYVYNCVLNNIMSKCLYESENIIETECLEIVCYYDNVKKNYYVEFLDKINETLCIYSSYYEIVRAIQQCVICK